MQQQPWEDLDSTQDNADVREEIGDLQGPEDPRATDDIERRKNEDE